MRLRHITATGIHRRLRYDCSIEPVTVIMGDNGTGKSSLLGLTRLVLNGPSGSNYPVLGASPDYDWSAALDMDDDGRARTVCRWMERGTHRATFGGKGGKLTDVQQAIAGGVGRAATWNLAAFLADTPAKRQAFLEAEVLRGQSWTNERTWAALEVAGVTRDDVGTVLTGGVVDTPDDDGRGTLTNVLNALRDAEREANSTALRLKRVVEQDDIDAAKEDLPVGTVTAWRAARARLDEAIAAKREARGNLTGKKAARQTIERSLTEAQAQLESLLSTDHDALIATAQEAAAAARDAEATALREGEDLKAAMEQAAEARDALQKDLETAQARAAQARAALPKTTIPGELDVATLTLLQPVVVVDRTTGHIRTVDGQGSVVPGLLKSREGSFPSDRFAVFDVATLPALGPVIAKALTEQATPLLDLAPLVEAADAAELTVTGIRAQLAAAKRTVATAQERLTVARQAYGDKKAAATDAARRLRDATEARASAGTREAALRADVERLGDELGDVLDGQIEAIDAEIAALVEEAADATKKADRLSDAAAAIAKRAENRSALNVAERTRSSAREMIKIIERVLSTMLAELVAPLEGPVSRITRTVIGADFRVRLDGGGASFWLIWDDHEAPMAASRSEEAVAMMALRCAVQQHLGGWRHLVLDDMENLAKERRHRFIQAMSDEIQAGRLDNFLGACVDDYWRPSSINAHLIYRMRS